MTGIIRDDVGATFVGRTSIGPLHFDDPMEVTQWRPPIDDEPGVCRIVKRGTVVTGWAVLTVSPDRDGATIRWQRGRRLPRRRQACSTGPTGSPAAGSSRKLVDGLLDDTH